MGTSVNLPRLVECYTNFGVLGVIIGMFLIGLLYRMLIAMYVHPRIGLCALSGTVHVTALIFDIGSATSMVLGGIPLDMLTVGTFSLTIELNEIDSRALLSQIRSV